MAVDITVPVLGEGVDSGDVLEVFVAEGDRIEKDHGLVELETDKATVTVPSTVAGVVTKVHVSEGDSIAIGGVIVSVETANVAAEAAPHTAPPTTVKSPIVENPATVESAPALTPIEPVKPIPSVAPVPTSEPVKPLVESSSLASDGTQSTVAAGPSIRRLAREVGIDLRNLSGSGDNGRVTREDVMAAVRGGIGRGATGGVAEEAGPTDGHGPIRIEKMPRIRQTIARKMHESWSTIPRVTNFDDADVTELEEIRQSNKKDYAARDIKLTTMPFVIKAVAMALKAHPVINAAVDLDAGQIIYKDYINVGIAVDTDRGLVVPSLRDADKLAIPEIARQLSDMAGNVRNNNFSIEDLRGGTFTISNLGAIGGTYSTPIINSPETAILLIGRSRRMPVIVDDEIQIRLMMPMSLSYDHRLIDGAAAARFLNEIIGYLKAPSRLLLAL